MVSGHTIFTTLHSQLITSRSGVGRVHTVCVDNHDFCRNRTRDKSPLGHTVKIK